jgi:hypothetical protein
MADPITERNFKTFKHSIFAASSKPLKICNHYCDPMISSLIYTKSLKEQHSQCTAIINVELYFFKPLMIIITAMNG